MKKITLAILFFFVAKLIFCQTIEVIVTDTVFCKVENYQYLLNINFNGNIPNARKIKFEKYLTDKNYNYSFFSKNSVQKFDGYISVKYKLNFSNEKEKNDFELKMNIENQKFTLTLMNMNVLYGEKEKLRLIEKLIQKGEASANLIAKGMGRKLGDMINLKESNDPKDRKLISDDKAFGNYNIGSLIIPDEKNEAKKTKTLIITFETTQ